MKLIEPSYEIIEQKPGLEGIYEQIELAGRTCYKSARPEGKTAKDFVDRLIASQHYAMLEHATIYLKVPQKDAYDTTGHNWVHDYYNTNTYSTVNSNAGYYHITSNYRHIIENEKLDDLRYLCEPTKFHEKRVTVKFITSIGIGRELLRHRKFSFANESTRYCNYSLEKKFGSEVTFIIPSWCKTLVGIQATGSRTGYAISIDDKPFTQSERSFYELLKFSEDCYMHLLDTGCKPQEAREVLPLATKSELIMTGFISDWKHVFDLRSSIAATGQPHPDMRTLIDPLMNDFIKNGWL